MKFNIVMLILLSTILFNCNSDKSIQQTKIKPNAPATYLGIIPCADCEGNELQINLLDDFTFMTKQVALGKSENAYITTGIWEFTDSTQTITLKSINQSPQWFVLTGDRVIEMLDVYGKKFQSELNYTLTKKENYEPITDSFPMKGMFRYMADAALFVDCFSQKKYPVAMENEYISLEREYLTNTDAGNPLLVTLEGSLVSRPKMEGEGEILTLVVKKLDKVWPQLDCKSSLSVATLKNTYWKLLEINGEPVNTKMAEREPHFVLRTDGKNIKGFGGCNNFLGTFEVKKNKIKFGPLAGTRKFCEKTMDLENSFMKVFSEVNNYKIFGEKLELYQDENIIAKFESVYFQ